MKECDICGQEWNYIIANPIKIGEVRLCKEHYQHLEKAKAEAYRDLIENKYFTRGENK